MSPLSPEEKSGANQPIARSDDLRTFRQFLDNHPDLATLSLLFQLTAIIDANVIISELIWLTKTRKNPQARTALQEVIAADTFKAVAPKWLKDEIQENIPEISEELNIPEEQLFECWDDYQQFIHFEENLDPSIQLPEDVQDPDDGPYWILQQQTGHVIYSEDPHLKNMGASVINSTVVMKLRDYSRYEAIEFSLLSTGIVLTGISIQIVKVAWSAIKGVFNTVKSLPGWAKFLIIGIVLVAILHPTFRNWIKDTFKNGKEKLPEAYDQLMELTEPIINEYANASKKADKALSDLKDSIPDEEKSNNS